MYRRFAESALSDSEEQAFDSEAYGKMFESDSVLSEAQTEDIDGAVGSTQKTKIKGKGKALAVMAGSKRRKSGSGRPSSSEGEIFDFAEVDNAEFSDDYSNPTWSPTSKKTPKPAKTPRQRVAAKKPKGKGQKTPVVRALPVSSAATVPLFLSSTSNETTPEKKGRSRRGQVRKDVSSEGEFFDFEEIDRMSTTDEEAPVKAKTKKLTSTALTSPSARKRGRPPKSPTSAEFHTFAQRNSNEGEQEPAGAGLSTALRGSGSRDDACTNISDFSVEDQLVRTISTLSVSALASSVPVIDISD